MAQLPFTAAGKLQAENSSIGMVYCALEVLHQFEWHAIAGQQHIAGQKRARALPHRPELIPKAACQRRPSGSFTGRTVTPKTSPVFRSRQQRLHGAAGHASDNPPLMTMVLMPITCPFESASGPPELPGAR